MKAKNRVLEIKAFFKKSSYYENALKDDLLLDIVTIT